MMRRSHTVSAGWRSMSTRKNIRLCDLQSCVSLCRGSGQRIYRRVWNTLKPGGIFLLNIEHPVFTAGVREDWIYDEKGRAMYWPVDDYYYPGERITLFLGENVKKYHHTLTQILMGLLNSGFALRAVEEAMPDPDMMDMPGMRDEMRRPMMLLVKAEKECRDN